MKRLLVFISILFIWNVSYANMLMPGVKTGTTPVLQPTTTVGQRVAGDHHPDLPISYQNGNCVNGQECPGAPVPRDRPTRESERSCLIDPNQPQCISDDDDSTISKDDDSREEITGEDPDEPAAPRGPTLACQNALSQTNQCSQVPQVNVGQTRGNILGNYDAATEVMRSGSTRLSGYSSQCQRLMSQCAVQCSNNNPYDKNLKGQCHRYQGQVSQASAEAQNLNAMSLQTEQAAAAIRSGESDFRQNLNIGQGIGIEADKNKSQVQNLQGTIKPVAGDQLLSTIKMERAQDSDIESAELEDKELEKKKTRVHQPTLVAATIRPVGSMGNLPVLPIKKVENAKSEREKIARSMHKGFHKLGKGSLKRRKAKSKNRQEFMSARIKSRQVRRSQSGLALPEEIIHRQWVEQQRNLASKRGTTRQDQSIFNSICLRYDRFAKDFNIDEGTSTCPPPY